MEYIYFFIITFIYSTIMYLYLRKKTNMNLKMLYLDNIWTAMLACSLSSLLYYYTNSIFLGVILILLSVPIIGFIILQIRFWRTPNRKLNATENQIVSPADGNIIYINKIELNDDFISIKKGEIYNLYEITQTNLINKPCWQIGINMTPFDVHKNCSPIEGQVILNKHVTGVFHSLKDFLSMTENERHTFVIKNDKLDIGVVLIASKRVRRIDSYVFEKQKVEKGQWIGMIRFGSQVDVFLPIDCNIKVKIKQQIYAKKTIIAEINEDFN